MIPMLSATIGPKFNRFPCYVQPKLNGVRALFQRAAAEGRAQGIFQSRDEKIWRTDVLQHLHNEFAQIDLGDFILDGELYRHGWRLQRINGAVATNRYQPREDTHEICFHVFDVVDPTRNFSERWLDIYNALITANLPHIKAVPTAYAHDRAQMERSFHLYTREGYEGIMLRPDGPYEAGVTPHGTRKNSKFLWKYKSWEDDEFYCIGWTQGEGKADIGIGALVCGTKDTLLMPQPDGTTQISGETFKVGTGFSDEDRIEFMRNPPIGKLIKVRYLCLTDDSKPFNPSFLCVM